MKLNRLLYIVLACVALGLLLASLRTSRRKSAQPPSPPLEFPNIRISHTGDVPLWKWRPCKEYAHFPRPNATWMRSLPEHVVRPWIQLRMLNVFHQIACKYKLRYWLGGDSGTLLGAVRSQSFVPFDNDVDVEVHPDDLTRFRDMLDQPGFRIPDLPDDLFMQTRHNSPTWSRLLPEVHPLYVKLRDLHSCYRLNAPSDYKEGYQLDMFARAPEGTFPLIECEIDGVPYPCPANWRDRLNLEFGPNWHIPTPPRLNDGTDKDGYQPSAWIGC